MTREGTQPLAALIAAVVAAGLLAACGSSDSSSSNSTGAPSAGSTTTDTTAQNGPQGGAFEGKRKQSGNGGQAKSHSQPHQDGSSGRTVAEVETPLKVSGGGSAQFRTNGGDNSVPEFGEEAGESELQEAAEVVHGFYVSRAAEEWDKACSYLAKPNAEQLEKLARQASKSKGTDCATALKAFTQPLPVAAEREITTVDAGSLRQEGEQGFLIYYGAGHVKYTMPLRNEGGSWKVTGLSGTALG